MWTFNENDFLLIACIFTALTSLALRRVPPNPFVGRAMLAGFVYPRHLRETLERR